MGKPLQKVYAKQMTVSLIVGRYWYVRLDACTEMISALLSPYLPTKLLSNLVDGQHQQPARRTGGS